MVHLFDEEVVSPGAFALGGTSFFEDRPTGSVHKRKG
jgi:hypothetical protein